MSSRNRSLALVLICAIAVVVPQAGAFTPPPPLKVAPFSDLGIRGDNPVETENITLDGIPQIPMRSSGPLLVVDLTNPAAVILHGTPAASTSVLAEHRGPAAPARLILVDPLQRGYGTADVAQREDGTAVYEWWGVTLTEGTWIFADATSLRPASALAIVEAGEPVVTTLASWSSYSWWDWATGDGPHSRTSGDGRIAAFVHSRGNDLYCDGTRVVNKAHAWRMQGGLYGRTDFSGSQYEYGLDTASHNSPTVQFGCGGTTYRVWYSQKWTEEGLVRKTWYTTGGGPVQQSIDNSNGNNQPEAKVAEAVRYVADVAAVATQQAWLPLVAYLVVCGSWYNPCDDWYTNAQQLAHGSQQKDITYFKKEDTSAHSYGVKLPTQFQTNGITVAEKTHHANRARSNVDAWMFTYIWWCQCYGYDWVPMQSFEWFFDVDVQVYLIAR